jgi:hypothetical protein
MNRLIPLMLSIVIAAFACGCSAQSGSSASEAPEKHTIEADGSMDTVGDALGADSFENLLDDHDSRYYVANDFYNMKSKGGLHIIPEFETYQQTAEHTCGPASALMVLNHYGNTEYNELEISELAGTSTSTGTSVEGLAGFFEGIGWNVESNASTEPKFEGIEEAEKFLISNIDAGTPVMIDWEDWSGHWQVVIGIDTCSKISPYDDVLIVADPYDVTDHYQDGYYTIPFGRFYGNMWREGPCAQKTVPYEQPYVIATPPKN